MMGLAGGDGGFVVEWASMYFVGVDWLDLVVCLMSDSHPLFGQKHGSL